VAAVEALFLTRTRIRRPPSLRADHTCDESCLHAFPPIFSFHQQLIIHQRNSPYRFPFTCRSTLKSTQKQRESSSKPERKQYKSSSKAVRIQGKHSAKAKGSTRVTQKQHESSTKAARKQYKSSTKAVRKQGKHSAKAKGSTKVTQKQHESSTKAAQKQSKSVVNENDVISHNHDKCF